MSKVQIGRHLVERNTAEAAIVYLAHSCDRASSHDQAGFSKVDVEWGHDLASKIEKYGRLTPKQHACVVMTKNNGGRKNGLIEKYRKQLKTGEFDVEVILDSKPIQQEMELAGEHNPKIDRQAPVKVFAFYRTTSQSGLAIKVDHNGNDAWLPLSQITYRELADGELEIVMPTWLASEKKLDHEPVVQEIELQLAA